MAARKNVIAHLEKLQLEDRVEISQEKYWMEWFMEVVGKGFRRHLNYEIFSHFTPNSYWRLK